jgi:hypothetical protein
MMMAHMPIADVVLIGVGLALALAVLLILHVLRNQQ